MDPPSQSDFDNLPSDVNNLRLNDQVETGLVDQAQSTAERPPAEQAASNGSYHEPGSICTTPKSSAASSKKNDIESTPAQSRITNRYSHSRGKKTPSVIRRQDRHSHASTRLAFGDDAEGGGPSLPFPNADRIPVTGSFCISALPSLQTPKPHARTPGAPKSILRRNTRDTPATHARDTREPEQIIAPTTPFSFNTPNAPNERGIPSRAHSTPIDGTSAASVSATPKTAKVKFNASTNFDIISEKKVKKIAAVVRKSVHVFHTKTDRWRQLKVKGAKELDTIVSYKMDAQQNIARTVSFLAVAHMVGMTNLLHELDEMAHDLRTAVLKVANVDLAEDEFNDVRPFKSLSLLKILAMMNYIAKSFRSDYSYRIKICTEVSRCCSYDAPVDRCVTVFSNIKSRWALEPMFEKNDSYLASLVTEIGGLDATD